MSTLSLPSTTGRLTLPRWLPLLLVVLLAIALRYAASANDDVSWSLTMAAKVLDGQRLYVDIIEVNPPATVFIYVLPALLGRLSGLPAEFFVYALVFLAAGLSLWLAGRILRRAGLLHEQGWTLASVCAAALLILPMHTFGEREQVALITFLPILALAAVRANGKVPDLAMIIVAGIGGGITAIIKPHFAAAIICTAAVAALYVRSWRPFFAPENWIAALLLAAYAVLVAVIYPQFISNVIPAALAVYVPVRTPLTMMLVGVSTPIWIAALALIALLKGRAILRPPYSLLVAASTGFLLAFFVQQKGWTYQSYPMLALVLIALALAVIEHWQREQVPASAGRAARLASALSASLLVGLTLSWMNTTRLDPAPLAKAVRTISPHPKILALSTFVWTGFPLTTMVNGTWVGRASSLWFTGGAWYRREHETLDPATERQLDGYLARDKAMVAEDIARHRPDVILVDHHRPHTDWKAWINSYQPLAAEMKHYRKYRSIEGIDILRRQADR